MAAEQETFLSHLVELRDRLIRSLIAIGIVFVPLAFYARELYSVLAAPLLATLPAGGQMIATDVVGVFLVPMKVALAVSFLIVLPYVLYQIWAFVVFIRMKRNWLSRFWSRRYCCSSSAWPSPTSLSSRWYLASWPSLRRTASPG